MAVAVVFKIFFFFANYVRTYKSFSKGCSFASQMPTNCQLYGSLEQKRKKKEKKPKTEENRNSFKNS